MSDYIKREDAIREAKAWSMFGKDDLVSRLERLPSADVVEVVRCKDCKFNGSTNENEADCGRMIYKQNGDDYCSYGERKEQ